MIERLIAALEPFATAHDALVAIGFQRLDEWRIVICEGDDQTVLNIEDLKRAKRAIEDLKALAGD